MNWINKLKTNKIKRIMLDEPANFSCRIIMEDDTMIYITAEYDEHNVPRSQLAVRFLQGENETGMGVERDGLVCLQDFWANA
jgi:hypothetical protein